MKKFVLPLLLGLTALTTHAQEYNQVSFEVEVSKTIANDELTATLTKSADNASAKALASTLNATSNKALELAKKYPSVKITTARHHTYPRYDNKGKINGFTGSSSVNIKSENFEQASELIAELQGFMTLENLDFGVSQTTKQAVENELKTEVINKFGEEARTVSHAFGASNYKIIKVDLNNSNNHIHIAPMVMSYDVSESKSVTPQQYEGGESRLTYGARGVIELVK